MIPQRGFLVRFCITREPQAAHYDEVASTRAVWVESCVRRALGVGWVYGFLTGIALAIVREAILTILSRWAS